MILVVGTGAAGMRHAKTLAMVDGVEVVLVPTRSGRARELEAAGHRVCESLEAGLALSPVAVVVATDSGRHAGDAERALAAGCHVLVEKPLTTRASDGQRLVEVAASHGRSLFVASCLRFDAGLQWVRDRLPLLGRLHLADVECLSWLPDWRPGRDVSTGYAARAGEGGVLLDLVHEMDYVLWLLGDVGELTARIENAGILGFPTAVEELAILTFRHRSGVLTTMRLSYVTRPPTRKLRIWGSEGLLEWDYVNRTASFRGADGQLRESTIWTAPAPMYEAQSAAFVSAVRGFSAGELPAGETGVAAVRLCDLARSSSSKGERMVLP
jgi:predicted dehydrogenase